jgi:hypothetical protein
MTDNIIAEVADVKSASTEIEPFRTAARSGKPNQATDVVPFNSSGDITGSLVVFEDARRAIADAETVEQVNKILALATGLAAAARKATNHEVEAEAAVLKLEAERKLGQLMEAQKESVGFSKGGRPKTGIPENPVSDKPPTLAEAGIDKNLADKARKAAAMPEEAFEEAKEAKRAAVLNGGERSKPRKRKSHFDAEHYAFKLGVHIEHLADLPLSEDHPDGFDQVLDYLLSDANFIDRLNELLGYPKFSAFLAAVAAKLGGDAGHGSDREFEIRFIGAQSEIAELQARIARLGEQRIEHLQGLPVADLMELLSDAQRADLFDRVVGQQIAQASPVTATANSKRLLTNLTGTLHWGLGRADPADGAQCLKIIAAKLSANKRDPKDICLAFAKPARRVS